MAGVRCNGLEHDLAIFPWIYLSPNLGNLSIRCDEKSIALVELHVLEGHQGHTVGLGRLSLRIRKQLKGQPILSTEALVAICRIEANAEHHSIVRLKLRQTALVGVGLNRASAGFVFGIEIKDHPFTPIIRKTDRSPVLRGQSEGGSLGSRL